MTITGETPPRIVNNQDDDDIMVSMNEDDIEEINDDDDIEYLGELNDNNEFIPASDEDEEDILSAYTCPKIDSKLKLEHSEAVFAVDISSDGKLIATASQEDKAAVWNLESGDKVFDTTGHDDSVIEARFNNDGSYLATADMNGNVKIWKVATKSLHDEYSTSNEVVWMFWHPSGNILFAGCKDGDTYVWRLPMVHFKILYGHGGENVCGILLPDGKRCAVGYNDGKVIIFDLKNSKEICHYKNKNGLAVTCIDAYEDNNIIAVGFEEMGTALFKATNGSEISILKKVENSEQFIEHVKFGNGPTNTILATACGDEVDFWDFSRHALRNSVKLNGEKTARMVWNKNGTLYVAGVYKNLIYAIDGRNGEILAIFRGHTDSVLDVTLSSDNQILASSADDGKIHVHATAIPNV